MENITFWLEKIIGLKPDIQNSLFETLLTILLLWLVQRLLTSVATKSIKNIEYRYQWQKGIGYFSFFIGLIVIGRIWLSGMETLVTFLGLLKEINVSNNSDPLEEYARFILNSTTKGIGCDNDTLTNSYLRVAEKMEVDGLIFNQVFGCHSISNCYQMLREKVRRKLEIPITSLNFNKIGEGVEQVKTRLTAFMEMLA